MVRAALIGIVLCIVGCSSPKEPDTVNPAVEHIKSYCELLKQQYQQGLRATNQLPELNYSNKHWNRIIQPLHLETSDKLNWFNFCSQCGTHAAERQAEMQTAFRVQLDAIWKLVHQPQTDSSSTAQLALNLQECILLIEEMNSTLPQ